MALTSALMKWVSEVFMTGNYIIRKHAANSLEDYAKLIFDDEKKLY